MRTARSDDLVIDVRATLGDLLIAVGKKPRFVYVDGKPTETVKGFAYQLLCPDRQLMISVGVDGDDSKQFTDEQLVGCPAVTLVEPTIKLYVLNGKPLVVARAKAIKMKK